MTTTTIKFRSIPEHSAGQAVTPATAAWVFGRWYVIAPRTNSDMNIMGISFNLTLPTTADVTNEILIELGFGKVHNPTTKVQIPYSFRSDTAVGYYLNKSVFLPEPLFVPAGTYVCVRAVAGGGVSNNQAVGFKLLVQDDIRPVMTNEAITFNNYMHVSGDNGISVTEKTR